jgi:hypothetical protein
MVDANVGSGAALAILDEAAIMALGVALKVNGAPSPAVVSVPIACQSFALVFADPMPWYQVAKEWSAIREVTTAAATNLSTTQKALLADAWQDAGATEFRKYGDRLAQAVTSLNKLVDVTAQECSTVGGLFFTVQVEFFIAMVTAIAECFAANFLPDPTGTTQTVVKTIIIGITLAIVGAIIVTAIKYIDAMSAIKQKINGAYAELQGHLHDQTGKLDGAAAKLDADRMATIADAKSWRLGEIPERFLH